MDKSSSYSTFCLRGGEIKAGSYVLPIEKPSGILNSVFRPPIFTAGGHQWAVVYYFNNKFIEVEIMLYSNSMNVYALLDISLLDKNGKPVGAELLNENKDHGKMHHFLCRNRFECWEKFISRDKFDAFLKNNNSLFCVIHVNILSSDWSSPCELPVPPSNLHKHLRKLWDDKEKSDVTFEAEGELIYAHRLVLAARSPVFNAELSGPLQDNCSKPIKIDDMKAVVFKAMLHFIYTDSVPDEMEGPGDYPDVQIGSVLFTQHLLVAADRYALDRLKLMCEDKLCRNICTDTVAISLTLAEQHNCPRLRKLCFDFAAKSENYIQMTFSEGYVHMVQSCPYIVQEFQKAVIIKPHS